ncbi:DUF924 family protein [Varunaivibrio sulfuroxidans]|uniref:Uncharacterized protein (DUF924 family) n=1 Tax=Varunaivibrio sulfuroxidans TaxID=1773489 RepID=A0A4R3J8D0_9PROT|nr:DUF924 family protein [Varunaivibrio sulfuroxidans]TCS61615.1 uncharacterized protein (DUF924 family) [Varunaivibrio sulfuroxidans]WES29510.1 DUF924 domain-containing protein [Varunaivibrio sulfuroxidans]
MSPLEQADLIRNIVTFWFGDPGSDDFAAPRRRWFVANPTFDDEIRNRFSEVIERARTGALDDMYCCPEGALALILVLDQFPRNIHRGTPQAFATDAKARALAARALDDGFDRALLPMQRLFMYLPFEHSEDIQDQLRAVALIDALGAGEQVDYARRHLEIIDRFGRFPHRNETLGRPSTPEERAFLKQPGSSF